MSKSTWVRLSRSLVVLIGGVILSGCSGEEKIQLKKVEMIFETPKDYKETRKGYTPQKGSSAGIGRDPSGVGQ